MNRRQELSRKIYEAGFKACNRRIGLNKSIAYFSVDWCWKMLPDSIDYLNSLVVTKNAIVYEESPDHISAYYCEIKDSLHEALLETICWCIDNGHIKAVK
jgi:hypothetical protein